MILGRPYDGIVVGIILFFVVYPFRFKEKPLFKNLCLAALFVYIGSLISITMIYTPPWNWNLSADTTQQAISNIKLKPFSQSLMIYRNCEMRGNFGEFIRLVGGNFIMLMPLGILVPLIYPKIKGLKVLALAIVVSLAIEGLQLFSNILLGMALRTVEIDDFIQNVSGCILAYCLFLLGRGIARKVQQAFQKPDKKVA